MRSPTPVSMRVSTVPCSSTPARMVPSSASRVRFSSTTESMPARCSRCDSSRPAGPAPTMPTRVVICTCLTGSVFLRDRRLRSTGAWNGDARCGTGIPDRELPVLAGLLPHVDDEERRRASALRHLPEAHGRERALIMYRELLVAPMRVALLRNALQPLGASYGRTGTVAGTQLEVIGEQRLQRAAVACGDRIVDLGLELGED